MNYLRDVQPFEDQGWTDAQIALHLSSRTAKPIPCDQAKILLEETGTVVEDPITRVRSGTLITAYNNMADPNMKALAGWFIAHVFGRGQQISSDTNPRAVQLAYVLSGLTGPLQSVAQELLALGGGQPQAGTTEADVAQSRADHQAYLLRDAAVNQVMSKAGAAQSAAHSAMEQGKTPAEILADAEAAWGAA